MRIGSFRLRDPLPEVSEPYVLATLRPWIDVNRVGSLILRELGRRYGAVKLGELTEPGRFYDFTRYRPVIHLEEGIRDISIPNTTVHYVRTEQKSDLLLLRLLEPHAHAELYISSVMKLLKTLKAKKYVVLGSMYDAVPHTRPLLVSGYGMGGEAREDVRKSGALPITYRGPSTIVNLITRKAAQSGIDASVFIVSLPQYAVLDPDYPGMLRLMEVLNTLYDIPIDKEHFERALEQRNMISEKLKASPEMALLLPQLESAYDMRLRTVESEGTSGLTPDIEEMLWKIMGKDIGKA